MDLKSKNYIGCVWKPKGVSSFKMLSQIKKFFATKKVGHMGTLDVLAEGVLPFAVGQYTKLIPYIDLEPKIYDVDISVGVDSISLDAEYVDEDMFKQALAFCNGLDLKKEELDFKLNDFIQNQIGRIEQLPPKFSALKVGGKRSYDLARKGQDFELKARMVDCFGISFESVKRSELGIYVMKFTISCGNGYYVRSFVRDLGLFLGLPMYMSDLKRKKVGVFDQLKCLNFDDDVDIGLGKVYPFCWDDLFGKIPKIFLGEQDFVAAQKGLSVYNSMVEGLELGSSVIGLYLDDLACIFEVNEFKDRKFLKVRSNFNIE